MLNLNEVEQKVLSFWADDHTFERSIENRSGCLPFVIYEGPPTANGRPGIHHVLTRTFKARFQTMNGRLVNRKAGWDEHGLPVEIEVQKELGLHTKPAVTEYGVQKFNEKCAASTQKYIGNEESFGDWLGGRAGEPQCESRRERHWTCFAKVLRACKITISI